MISSRVILDYEHTQFDLSEPCTEYLCDSYKPSVDMFPHCGSCSPRPLDRPSHGTGRNLDHTRNKL